MDDWQLLNEYVTGNSESAFRSLVDRYAGMVYHIALRQMNNRHLAEEVTQTVFITLARKAPTLTKGVVLHGWLFRATRFAIMNLARETARRRHHQEEACAMQNDSDPHESAAVWEEISPALNDAMDCLPRTDREVLIIRFFDDKSHRDVGRLLGISEDTAKKRVSRALEKLRSIFAKRGVVVSSIALAAAFSACGVQAAPAGLAATVATAAMGPGASGTGAATASKSVVKLMAWAKVKAAAMVGAAVLFAAGTVAVVEEAKSTAPGSSAAAAQGATITSQVLQPDGKPASGATIYYFHSTNEYIALDGAGHAARIGRAVIDNPRFPRGVLTDTKEQSDSFVAHPDAVTDADGRFSIPLGTAPDEGRRLVILADEGCTNIFISNLGHGPVTLQPWAKITGRLMIGDKPGANQIIEVGVHNGSLGFPLEIQPPRFRFGQSSLWGEVKVKTDSDGHFEFPRVLPGDDLIIGRLMDLSPPPPLGRNHGWDKNPSQLGLTQTMPVTAKGGETVSIQLGGHGRTITGRLSKGRVGIAGNLRGEVFYMNESAVCPLDFTWWDTNKAEQDRERAWVKGPQHLAALAAKRQYVLEVAEDGAFKIQDVPPGEYDIHVPVSEDFEDGPITVAEAAKTVVVEAPAPGQPADATPIDIGTLEIEWISGQAVYQLQRGRLGPPRRGPENVRVVDTDVVSALDDQVKERQSIKPDGKEVTIDLSHYVNSTLTAPIGDEVYNKDDNFSELPSGKHVFGGVPFDVSGIVQLNSTTMDPYLRALPEQVTILMHHKFKKLHLLRSEACLAFFEGAPTNIVLPAPAPVASLIFHYADGTQSEIPIVSDQWSQPFKHRYVPPGLDELPANVELAWVGSNPYMKKIFPTRALHLYRTSFDNPHPDLEVTSMDFVSKMTTVAPFMAGLTVE